MVRTKLFREFISSFKEEQFHNLERQLIDSDTECLLIGNYNIVHTDYDAIVVTQSDIFVVEFKESNCEGVITVNDAFWTYPDNSIVWAGNHASNPFGQMKHKRNCLWGMLRREGIENVFVKTIVAFSEPFRLRRGETTLRGVCENNHGWFRSSTADAIVTTIGMLRSNYYIDIETLAQFFKMKRSIINGIFRRCCQFTKNILKFFVKERFSTSDKKGLLYIDEFNY